MLANSYIMLRRQTVNYIFLTLNSTKNSISMFLCSL